jgi:predicted nuclease of predicted toxin-antitoxin system
LRVLLDVHISNRIAAALREANHDVERIAEIDRQMADNQILSLAIAEGRVLVTEDSDFSELIFGKNTPVPPALVYVRCRPFDQQKIVTPILTALSDDRLPGHVAVVTPENIRFRLFPKVQKL